jgi:hypothetical protein
MVLGGIDADRNWQGERGLKEGLEASVFGVELLPRERGKHFRACGAGRV